MFALSAFNPLRRNPRGFSAEGGSASGGSPGMNAVDSIFASGRKPRTLVRGGFTSLLLNNMIAKDLGFVLKRYNFRETSLIATLYTAEFGKITGILKGFYTFKKEFSTNFDIFSLNEVIFYPKKSDIWLVSFADLVADFSYLRKNKNKSRVAATFLNIIDKTAQINDRNLKIFNLLKAGLEILEKEKEEKILYSFLIKFLTFSGFKPQLNQCVACQADISRDTYFSIKRGGLICKGCCDKSHDLRRLGRDVISSLLYIQNNEFTRSLRLNPSYDCEKEIIYLLREFLCYYLDFDILGVS
jgi:DNA repair protein RecO (recombination protein O)